MICEPCRKGGRLTTHARRYGAPFRKIILRAANRSHGECRGQCDCQHRGPADPQPPRAVSE